jgi:hypothetical protein
VKPVIRWDRKLVHFHSLLVHCELLYYFLTDIYIILFYLCYSVSVLVVVLQERLQTFIQPSDPICTPRQYEGNPSCRWRKGEMVAERGLITEVNRVQRVTQILRVAITFVLR